MSEQMEECERPGVRQPRLDGTRTRAHTHRKGKHHMICTNGHCGNNCCTPKPSFCAEKVYLRTGDPAPILYRPSGREVVVTWETQRRSRLEIESGVCVGSCPLKLSACLMHPIEILL